MTDHNASTLDRHALAMAIWLSFGLVAIILFKIGFSLTSWAALSLAFTSLFSAFIAHVLVNIIFETRFSAREVSLGLTVFGVCLLWFGFAVLIYPQYRSTMFLPVTVGLVTLTAAVVFTMMAWLGVRGAFESFDVIRSFAPRKNR